MADEQVYGGVEKALRKYFGKRGDRVVQDNVTCVKRGYEFGACGARVQPNSAKVSSGCSSEN